MALEERCLRRVSVRASQVEALHRIDQLLGALHQAVAEALQVQHGDEVSTRPGHIATISW